MKALGMLFIMMGLFVPLTLIAQETKPSDPFDLTATETKMKELGIPTVSLVDEFEQNAKDLFTAGKWREAATALHEYAKQANWLANLISAGLEPYYNASYDDRKFLSYSQLNSLGSFEEKANEYKRKRNRAMVMQVECMVKLGDKEKAVALLVKALDLINVKNDLWWTRARKQFYSLIGLK